MSVAATAQQELARTALELQIQYDKISEQLEAKKEELRVLANGRILNIVVEGVGKVDITAPRAGSEKVTFTFNEDKLAQAQELRAKLLETGLAKEVLVINEEKLEKSPAIRQKLIEKGVMAEEVKKVSAAKASVRIKPNV